MNTWRDQPIYSSDTKVWVDLMNRSTQDWGVGYLPDKVFATNGSLANGSAGIPSDPKALVIVYAGNGFTNSSPTPSVVYGCVFVVAFLLTCLLAAYNWTTMLGPSRNGILSLFRAPDAPRSSSTRAGYHSARTTAITGIGADTGTTDDVEMTASGGGLPSTADFADMGPLGTSAQLFGKLIRELYYEPVQTELELGVKQTGEDIEDDDIEDVIALARRMLEFDNELWSNRSTVGYREAMRQTIAEKRDAITGDITETVRGWARARWDTDERAQLTNIMETLYIEEQRPADGPSKGKQRQRVSAARTDGIRRWLSQRSRVQY